METAEQIQNELRGLWSRICEKYSCNHHNRELRIFVTSKGTKRFVFQCLRCGEYDTIARANLTESQIKLAGPYDVELRKSWSKRQMDEWKQKQEELNQKRQAALNNEKEAKSAAFWKWYDKYLLSPQWQKIRRKVIERCGGICEGCGERPAYQVHHLTYDRVGEEMLFDLVAVCLECHRRIHPDKELG